MTLILEIISQFYFSLLKVALNTINLNLFCTTFYDCIFQQCVKLAVRGVDSYLPEITKILRIPVKSWALPFSTLQHTYDKTIRIGWR
jgi:hypothetical protein